MRKIWHDGKKGLAWIDQAMDKHSDPFKEPRGHSLGITKWMEKGKIYKSEVKGDATFMNTHN